MPLIFSALLALLTTAPTSQPSAKPEKPLTSIESLIEQIPVEDRPSPGDKWNKILVKYANDWLLHNLASRRVRIPLYISSVNDDDKSGDITVSFIYAVNHDSLGLDWPSYFNDLGCRWNSGVSGTFDASFEKQFARVHTWENHHKGDRLIIEGLIRRVRIGAPQSESPDMSVSLQIYKCSIVKP